MKFYFLFLFSFLTLQSSYRIPIDGDLHLTQIGDFGIIRKARPGIPAHLHTGIDILPPDENYRSKESIYPIAKGVIISKRTDGAYGQLIIEHDTEDGTFWSVYEHITEIEVDLFQAVEIKTSIARFFNEAELNEIGWQFNHFHLEILKKQPISIKPDERNPERLFSSYSLSCYTEESLKEHFYDPIQFLTSKSLN